eukprot:gnl/TRDRNA2_/TRDRNA2_178053_c0_seq1.p1 gnl/TRDRNA2_/TRDRNA2_178053_c0~~gnl/TRDRNA2_/TRDRNA2_178053_c0_seq1.p1  ORF type:complete len:818 (-),score=159.38 gnl/TRDRNA2_/TRDRNA2_178053_c0_seq1:161-2467(-)
MADAQGESNWMGVTQESLEACQARKNVRDTEFDLKTHSHSLRAMYINVGNTVADAICGVLPDIGAMLAPLGLGAETAVKTGEICQGIAEGLGSAAEEVNERFYAAWSGYKEENDIIDLCGELIEPSQYKTFCDLHCMEDAILKGNSAILKSMKTQELHMIKTINAMTRFYTNEVFDKLKETQEQINHNGVETTRILTSYFGQVMTASASYAKSLTDQINTQVQQLNKNIGDFVIPPMTVLQGHMNVINKNLMALAKWLNKHMPGNEDKKNLADAASVLEQVSSNEHAEMLGTLIQRNSSHVTESFASFQHSLGECQQALGALIMQVHGGANSAQALDEHKAMPLIDKLKRKLAKASLKAGIALRKGDPAKARKQIVDITAAINEARAGLLDAAAPISASEQFQRRTDALLGPARQTTVMHYRTAGDLHAHLLTFHTGQSAIMDRARSLAQLSDQMEHNAAADMLVRFDDEALKAKHSAEQAVTATLAYLNTRATSLKLLEDTTRADRCNSEGMLQEVGLRLAQQQRAETGHLTVLSRSWQSTADAVTRATDILVDGGLLLHYLRLVGLSVKLTGSDDKHILGVASALPGVEQAVKSALEEDGMGLIEQTNNFFDLAQKISDLFTSGINEVPEESLDELRVAWSKIRTAASELHEGLLPANHGKEVGQIRRSLLLGALSGTQGIALNQRFAPTEESVGHACAKHADPSAPWALWHVEPEGHSVLLDVTGAIQARAVRCDVRSGLLEEVQISELNFGTADLGAFLLPLMK